MKFRTAILYLSAFTGLALAVPALAQQRRLINENCRQGSCWETFLLNKRLIHSDTLGGNTNRLYEVELEVVDNREGTSRRTQWAYCSLEEPYVAFDFPDEDDEFLYLHYLSPANTLGMAGYNHGSHSLYWAVCHDQFDQDVYGLASLARQIGYSNSQMSTQIMLPKSFLRIF